MMSFLKRLRTSYSIMLRGSKTSIESKYDRRRMVLEQNILHLTDSGISDTKYCDHDVIVSLTTYGRRLYEVAIAIESLMEQTLKANRIILWLQDELKNTPLPVNLQLLQKRGLEIYYCKDLRSFKKLIPSLRKFPEDAIITVDDDLIYEYDFLEHLIVHHQRNLKDVFCYRMRKIQLNEKGGVLPYSKWPLCLDDNFNNSLKFVTTGGGVLFPPHCFKDEVFNEKVFLDICKFADDIWVNAMLLFSKQTIRRIEYKKSSLYFENDQVQSDGLFHINQEQNYNDIQFHAVYEKYSLFKLLHE